jgi:hypothetical protein
MAWWPMVGSADWCGEFLGIEQIKGPKEPNAEGR